MADQMGTPGSNADTSTNGGKVGAPKDKGCPFCHQQFTSSSLGRHLDLYIKEKNPKPADGIHDVDQIRKIRGGITRRQPRNSTSRRDGSTPRGTPGPQDRMSPRVELARGDRSPSLRRDDIGPSNLMYGGKPRVFVNRASWESTGVMNSIPPARSSDARSWDGEERGEKRLEGRNRSVSKQVLAKSTFEQKQKMIDALDNAKAAELALREIMGAIRAAKTRLEGPQIFEYDPLTLDFPALCLQCLPPPPTLFSSTPLGSKSSWSISPPDELQFQAIRSYFSSAFHSHRISLQLASTVPVDDLSYPPREIFASTHEDPSSIAARAEAAASELESKISEHLHNVFTVWTSLSPPRRQEIWTLELARGVGRKSEEIEKLKRERDFTQQESIHLKQQNDEMSRIQLPREFRLVPPAILPIDKHLMTDLLVNRPAKIVGYCPSDRHENFDTMIERVIKRWKGVVREVRRVGPQGMAAQRSLSGESINSGQTAHSTSNAPNQSSDRMDQPRANEIESIGSDVDADADADADMEDDDSFIEMCDAPVNGSQRQPITEAPGFRLSNGTGNAPSSVKAQQGGRNTMEGIENQVVHGYVRIGA